MSKLSLISCVALMTAAAPAFAGEKPLDLRCGDFQHLADGSWKGGAKAVVLLHGSRIDFSGSVLRAGGTRIDGVDMKTRLDRQCGAQTAQVPAKDAGRH